MLIGLIHRGLTKYFSKCITLQCQSISNLTGFAQAQHVDG
jgi:hypothetical protein